MAQSFPQQMGCGREDENEDVQGLHNIKSQPSARSALTEGKSARVSLQRHEHMPRERPHRSGEMSHQTWTHPQTCEGQPLLLQGFSFTPVQFLPMSLDGENGD